MLLAHYYWREGMKSITNVFFAVAIAILTGSCKQNLWNNPHNDITDQNILFSSFSEPPKTLDPAKAYDSSSYSFINQIYEAPLQYHYLKRPYQLVPLTAAAMPTITYLDANNKEIAPQSNLTAKKTVYHIAIKPHIMFQQHPAFAKDKNGKFLYHNLNKTDITHFQTIYDFPETSNREVTAADFVYEIKRLASNKVNSPIFGIMQKYIVGFGEYSKKIATIKQQNNYLNLNAADITGVKVTGRYTYSITINGNYPQFEYWLAMPFFAPIPYEADIFYSQPYMKDNNLTFDWFPLGTGPFILSKNNPNRVMILSKNPDFHGEKYPSDFPNNAKYARLAEFKNKELPMVDSCIFSLEKENIPYWYKFMQGYYDRSTVSSDNFDQAITISETGDIGLAPTLKELGMSLETAVEPTISYIGFNMQDPVVGGDSEQHRYLRQAISIAINYEEYINIFLNGRAIAAHGAIPPGIFGSSNDSKRYNPYVYNNNNGKITRKSIHEAKELLAKANYPNGRNIITGKPLTLYLDNTGNSPNAKSQIDWYSKQFAKLGINLFPRTTSWNRLQEKLRTGQTQLFQLGWNADYPDAENFLFLLYSHSNNPKDYGENKSQYNNSEYNKLFNQMVHLPDNVKRQNIITKMNAILQKDSPWIWGIFPKSFVISHSWNSPLEINTIAHNTLKYIAIDGKKRKALQQQWNIPNIRVLWVLLVALCILIISTYIWYRRQSKTIGPNKFSP